MESSFLLSERKHHYGKNVHLLSNPYFEKILSRFSTAEVCQPAANSLVRALSQFLTVQAVNQIFTRDKCQVKTRMSEYHSEATYEASLLSGRAKAVVVDLMRAGILPSEVCFEVLHQVLKPENIRQDHILLNRKVNAKQEVVGIHMSGHKIGGPVKDAYVFLPDPMGATGSTLSAVIELYQNLSTMNVNFKGRPKKFIALHFIVTPEYLKRVKEYSDVLEIFALRLDRGLSSKAVLKMEPGKNWKDERGLNEKQYIVPGAGGIGEILNNSFV